MDTDLALSILHGLGRTAAGCMGGYLLALAAKSAHADPAVVGAGVTLVTFAAGASARSKIKASAKIKEALATPSPTESNT